jgi:hypothetical protein
VRILCFSVQIWILLKKPVQTQFKPFHLEEITQPPFQPLGGVGHCFAWHVRVSLDLYFNSILKLGGVGHCFAWHVRVSLDLFYFILKQKNLYIVGCAQCIWDITAYFLLPEFKYIYLPIYILSYNQTLAYTTKINFFPLHFNNFLEENLSKSPSVSQLLPVVIPS